MSAAEHAQLLALNRARYAAGDADAPQPRSSPPAASGFTIGAHELL